MSTDDCFVTAFLRKIESEQNDEYRQAKRAQQEYLDKITAERDREKHAVEGTYLAIRQLAFTTVSRNFISITKGESFTATLSSNGKTLLCVLSTGMKFDMEVGTLEVFIEDNYVRKQ